MDSVEQELRDFIVQDLKWSGPPELITPDYPLIENEVIDSLAIFEIVNHLEDHYEITLPDDALVPENFATLGAMARLVTSRPG
jgi:acyl carrier protein